MIPIDHNINSVITVLFGNIINFIGTNNKICHFPDQQGNCFSNRAHHKNQQKPSKLHISLIISICGVFLGIWYIFKLLPTHSVSQGYKAVTHPSSSGAFAANVREHPLITWVRSTEWHFFNRLINNKWLKKKTLVLYSTLW